jgi:catechol 2,3-dioxygenase-like lactoylglutathione lyase family enzyme
MSYSMPYSMPVALYYFVGLLLLLPLTISAEETAPHDKEVSMTYVTKYAELGKSRLETLSKIRSPEDFEKMWKEPQDAAVLKWGDCWKACVEFAVPQLEAEVGFYIEVLGFGINATWDNRVMLISSDGAYTFTLYSDKDAQPANALKMQFMVSNIAEIDAAMRKCGVPYVQELKKVWGENNDMKTIVVKTPSGIDLTVWGKDK